MGVEIRPHGSEPNNSVAPSNHSQTNIVPSPPNYPPNNYPPQNSPQYPSQYNFVPVKNVPPNFPRSFTFAHQNTGVKHVPVKPNNHENPPASKGSFLRFLPHPKAASPNQSPLFNHPPLKFNNPPPPIQLTENLEGLSEDNIVLLENMGFTRKHCIAALQLSNNDMENAVNLLLTDMPSVERKADGN